MAQEIEIEFKNLLTKDEFELLLNQLPFPTGSVTQTNYYFETKDFLLRQKQAALRIRHKNNSYTLTLKQPHSEGLLETHDQLTKEEAECWIKGNIIPQTETSIQLKDLGIPQEELRCFGHLLTKRTEMRYNNTIVVLDKSIYNNQVDYELEVEANDYQAGLEVFNNLLTTYQIDQKPTPNKIERFFATL